MGILLSEPASRNKGAVSWVTGLRRPGSEKALGEFMNEHWLNSTTCQESAMHRCSQRKKRLGFLGTSDFLPERSLRPSRGIRLGVNDGRQVLAVAWGLGERCAVAPDISPLIRSTQRNASPELSVWTNPSVHQVAPRAATHSQLSTTLLVPRVVAKM